MSLPCLRGLGLLLAALSILLASVAHAEETRGQVLKKQLKTPPTLAPRVSYEWERTERVLRAQNMNVELEPEGKRITRIVVVREDVFARDEVWPLWFNWFHGLTREKVVRRELLFREGDVFREALSEETMRNLRSMAIFALVRVVPVKGEKPGEVGVLVYTRDLWSLRLETDVNITSQLNSLQIRGTERNAFGHNKSLSASFTLIPYSYTLTESYYARRVLGSSLALSQQAGLVFNRKSHDPEGKLGSLSVGQPYYSLAQRFAWSANYLFDDRIVRNLYRGEIAPWPLPGRGAEPYARSVYRRRQHHAYLTAQVRRGHTFKQTFGAGWDFRTSEAHAIDESMVAEGRLDEFERTALPFQRTDNGPTFTYDVFMPEWAQFVNLTTYGQTENVRVGPFSSTSLRVPIGGLGSTATALVMANDIGLTLAPAGALIDARASSIMRYTRQRVIDQRFTFVLRGASPVFSIFRFVASLSCELRRRDSQKTAVTLGSDNGLRGYVSQAFSQTGADRWLGNFELRTLPIEWQAVHLGGVLFYDVGSVHNHLPEAAFHHAVGVGIRLLFPQFNRQPFSFDGGFGLDGGLRFVPAITGGQVVPLTAAEDTQ